MKRLKQFLKWMYGYKLVYLISILLLIALQYLRTLSPLFITHIIDTILKGEEASNLPGFITSLFSGDTVKEKLLEAYTSSEEDLEYIQEEFSTFCKFNK